MSYFRRVSDILYQSQFSDVTGSDDYIRAKNIFRRAKIRDDIFQSAVAFTKYKVIGEERPDQVAEKVYGNSAFDWIVLLSNNIINVRTEWPLSDSEIDDYIFRKYTQSELSEPHHYETTSVFDSRGKLIVPTGKLVDSNFSVTYFDEIINTSVTTTPVKSISNYEYEIKLNDNKRNIYTLRPRFLQTIIDDMEDIMSYGFSSQYVDNNTKKGENLRVLSPR
jgi:hypothetical protein